MFSNSSKSNTNRRYEKFRLSNDLTLAEFNKVSLKDKRHTYSITKPYRIHLPEYFNIPEFKDTELNFSNDHSGRKDVRVLNQKNSGLTKRMKDLAFLAQGMKRAKNMKQESRYYFIQGVLTHNSKEYRKAIEYFEKFFKMVLHMKDQKSMELVLNAIGICYMSLNEFQKALQFHLKQGEISERADLFVMNINAGECLQMMGKNDEAYSRYQHALQNVGEAADAEYRKGLVQKLAKRVQRKILAEEVFMTEKNSPRSPVKNKPRSRSPLIYKKCDKNSSRSRVKFAIEQADEKLQDYLDSMRESLLECDK